MATFSDLKTTLARDLRDTSNAVFSTAELGDLINRGIDALADFYPEEIMSSITVVANTSTYSASSFTKVYRVDVYTSAGSYRHTLPSGIGDGPNTGWEMHGGVLYFPPVMTWADAGDSLRVWGYGRYVQLSADSQTTDLDTSGQWAVLTFAQMRALDRLLIDRAKFQQWQEEPGNSNVSLIQIAQTAGLLRQQWRDEQQRLRRLRKVA